jgi:hypothetical protein
MILDASTDAMVRLAINRLIRKIKALSAFVLTDMGVKTSIYFIQVGPNSLPVNPFAHLPVFARRKAFGA